MKKKVISVTARAALQLLVMVFSAAAAWGQNYVATDGTAGVDNNQGYAKLFDGNTSTKWCVVGLNGMAYVDFYTTSDITPKGYRLTTGDDNATYHGRNPKNWVIKAKYNQNDEWTVLSTVTNDWKMEDLNKTDYKFYFPNNSAYRFFRLKSRLCKKATCYS